LQQRLGIDGLRPTIRRRRGLADPSRCSTGRLAQVGPPEEVYHRPASRTVAAFFGMPNLLASRVTEVRRESETTFARVSGDGWEGWCAAPGDVRAGEEVTAIVRPEAIQMSRERPSSSPSEIVWNGRLTEGFFRGSRRFFAVAVGELLFHVDGPPDRKFLEGETVFLSVLSENTWVVR
jgi:ABC-type Fe3+/spermidine/putrescine transport system ATPase subunit